MRLFHFYSLTSLPLLCGKCNKCTISNFTFCYRSFGVAKNCFSPSPILRAITPVLVKKNDKRRRPTLPREREKVTHLRSEARLDYCFNVDLKVVPNPPEGGSDNITRSAMLKRLSRSSENNNIVTVGDFVCVIPTFFVPVDEVLNLLEGYTEQHIDAYLTISKGVEVVTLAGRRFIRIYGGFSSVPMEDTYLAEERFMAYRIDPSLAGPFIKAFEGETNKWMSLNVLLKKAGPDAENKLPYQGPHALLYFAQMRHIFDFAVKDGGMVMLRESGFDKLDNDNSPIPAPMADLHSKLGHGRDDLRRIFREEFPEYYTKEVLRFFPSIEEACKRHSKSFYLGPDGVVMRQFTYLKKEQEKLPLEVQLKRARQHGNNRLVHRLEKKIFLRDNPDSPLLEKEELAKEIYNFLPKKGYVLITLFVWHLLPKEMSILLNGSPKFFKNFPQYFQVFEYGGATRWCVARAGVELPSGILRSDYSGGEVLRLVAASLQKNGPTKCSMLPLTIPAGAYAYIKFYYVSMHNYVSQNSEYFSVLMRGSRENEERTSVVSLIKMPPNEIEDDEETPL